MDVRMLGFRLRLAKELQRIHGGRLAAVREVISFAPRLIGRGPIVSRQSSVVSSQSKAFPNSASIRDQAFSACFSS